MPRRAIMLALAALYEVALASEDVPIAPSLQLRALLTLLWRQSNRDRDPYASFWRAVTEVTATPHPRDGQARRMYGQSNWLAIARTLGIDPAHSGAWNGMSRLVDEHYREQTDEHATRQALAMALHEAALTREIIATKGNPHSSEAHELMARRRSAGLTIEGEKC